MEEFERDRALYRQSCDRCGQWQGEVTEKVTEITETPSEFAELERKMADIKVC